MSLQARLALRLGLVILVIAAYFLIVRRAPSEAVRWRQIDEGEMTGERAERLAHAQRARDALFRELSATLQSTIAARGAAQAIGVCRDEAPRIAARVAKEQGLSIGRTSLRLRNPANLPPRWAAEYVHGVAEQPAYFEGPERRLGVLLPIRVQPACLVCHGSLEDLAPGVREALADDYIEDRATGFREGDLRGWFWIEI